MNALSLGDIMDRNIKLFSNRPSLDEVSELADSHHLIVMDNNQPIEVLVKGQPAASGSTGILPQVRWESPILVNADTQAMPFYEQHISEGRPIIVLDSAHSVQGLITPAIFAKNVVKHYEALCAFFQTLLDTVNEAVTVVTQDGIVSHWNLMAQDTYSITQKHIIGKHIANFFEQGSLTTLKILDEGRPVHQSYHCPQPGTHVLINASPVVVDGQIIGAISAEQDITQIVRLNENLLSTSSQLRDLQQKISPSDDPFSKIIGKGHAIRHTISMARKISSSEATVLITGESGVGKELFAQAIHLASPRASQPLIALNCGAIPTALFESELFGYQGGAFTGAEKKGKPGKLELAEGGTLFLDEIGELPLDLQVKLLRVLQDRCFYRLGGTAPITVSTRIIAATNRDLEKMIKAGMFREDLYYRLNVITLEVPPLRERTEDISDLVQTFLHEFARKNSKPIPSVNPELIVSFLSYHWPGNVRELHNVTERLAVLADEGMLEAKYLPSALQRTITEAVSYPVPSSASHSMNRTFQRSTLPELERICAVLDKTRGNKTAAAKLLGMSRGTLYYKLKQYALV